MTVQEKKRSTKAKALRRHSQHSAPVGSQPVRIPEVHSPGIPSDVFTQGPGFDSQGHGGGGRPNGRAAPDADGRCGAPFLTKNPYQFRNSIRTKFVVKKIRISTQFLDLFFPPRPTPTNSLPHPAANGSSDGLRITFHHIRTGRPVALWNDGAVDPGPRGFPGLPSSWLVGSPSFSPASAPLPQSTSRRKRTLDGRLHLSIQFSAHGFYSCHRAV